MTIEVRYGREEQATHDALYREVIDQMAYPGDEDEHGRQDMSIFRGLCLLAFSPKLIDMITTFGTGGTYSDQVAEYLSAPDYGFTAFWMAVFRDPSRSRPSDALLQVSYLITQCRRLREMLRILHREGAFDVKPGNARPRFLIISYWPIICWMVEMNIRRIGLKSEVITAAQSAEERAAAVPELSLRVMTIEVCYGSRSKDSCRALPEGGQR